MPVARSRIPGDREIFGPFELEQPQMWMPAHQDHLEHRVLKGQLRLLRHDRHTLCDGASGQVVEWRSVEPHLPRSRPSSAAQQAEQRRLARAVGPDDADHGAPTDFEADVVEYSERGRLTPAPSDIRTKRHRRAAIRTPANAVRPGDGYPNTSS